MTRLTSAHQRLRANGMAESTSSELAAVISGLSSTQY